MKIELKDLLAIRYLGRRKPFFHRDGSITMLIEFEGNLYVDPENNNQPERSKREELERVCGALNTADNVVRDK